MNDDSPTVSQPPPDDEQHTKSLDSNRSTLSGDVELASASTIIVNRYLLGEEIAQGGMGVVFYARDTVLNRDVAIKLLQSKYQPDSIAARRFVEEARIAGQLQHPGIAPVHDLGTTSDGRPFLAMKLIKGQTLSTILTDAKLPQSNLIDIFTEICQTVAYAHSKGVIHRDLKPANIMVGAFGEVQVMDWGLAKLIGSNTPDDIAKPSDASAAASVIQSDRTPDSATQAGSVLGTPAYMPPEQAKGEIERTDARADVFALGAILCELLTGKPPYTGRFDEVRARSIIGDLKPAHERLAQCPADRELINLATRCLTADPANRPNDADELKREMVAYRNGVNQRLLQAEQDQAKAEVTIVEQSKRRKVWLALAAAMLVGTVMSLILTAWALTSRNQAETKRIAAEQAEEKAALRGEELEREKSKVEKEFSRAERELDRADRFVYANNMQSVDRAWQEYSGKMYQDRLLSTRWDLRGWEWHHAWNRSNEHVIVKGHSRLVSSVAFNPDGKQILSGSSDHTLRLWDAGTGIMLAELNGHIGRVNSVAFSPKGQRIVSGSSDHTLRLWDARTGATLTELKGHTSPVSSVVYSPDGKRIVSGSWDNTLRLWDAETGVTLTELKGHSRLVSSLAFSPDGQRIVSGSWDNTLRLWDAGTGVTLAELKGHTSTVHSVAFSPDGQRIVSGSSDNTLRLWDAGTWATLAELKGHTSTVHSVAFSPDGQRIVSGSSDNTLRLWDVGRKATLAELKGHIGRVQSVAFSPDGQRIVSGSSDNTLRLWDVGRKATLTELKGHTSGVNTVAFSPDGQRIVSGSSDNTLRLWDVGRKATLTELKGHTSGVNTVAFSPDGQRIVSGSSDNTLRLWDVVRKATLAELKGHIGRVQSVAFSPDGQRIVSGSSDNTLRLWDVRRKATLTELKGHTRGVNTVAFSPDGQRIVSGSEDNTLRLWDAETGEMLAELKGHTSLVQSVAFSPDGQRIVSGSEDNTLRLWDTGTGKPVAELKGHRNAVLSVAFTPDGQRIVSGSEDNTIRLWDASSGATVAELKGHTGPVPSVAFSPDGQRIVSGSLDDTLRLWDGSAADRKQITTPLPLISGISYSEDGSRIHVKCDDQSDVINSTTGRRIDPTPPFPGVIVTTSNDGLRKLILEDGIAYEVDIALEKIAIQKRADRLKRMHQPRPDWNREEYQNALDSNQLFAAKFHLQQFVKHVPTDWEAIVNLAAVDRIVPAAELARKASDFINLNQYPEGIAAYRNAWKLHPTNEYCRGLSFSHCRYDQQMEGYRIFEKALKENPFWEKDFAKTDMAMLAIQASLFSKEAGVTDTERIDIRKQAFLLMVSELNRVKSYYQEDKNQNRDYAISMSTNWLDDENFAPMRFGFPIAGIPHDEMKQWWDFFADVRKLKKELEPKP